MRVFRVKRAMLSFPIVVLAREMAVITKMWTDCMSIEDLGGVSAILDDGTIDIVAFTNIDVVIAAEASE